MKIVLIGSLLIFVLAAIAFHISPSRASQEEAIRKARAEGYEQGVKNARADYAAQIEQAYASGVRKGSTTLRWAMEADLEKRGVGHFTEIEDGLRLFVFRPEFRLDGDELFAVACDRRFNAVLLSSRHSSETLTTVSLAP